MATLVLTAVGGLVAGPVGAAIGAIAGQQVDSRLFAPKARQGPRLGELAVQTSSYGAAIPKIFGTMRVAGTVIWSTDLKERKQRSGGGKGRPAATSYTYSASFAVALSGRPIRGVRRIWADGKLLRGAAGDFKSETGYRLYLGTEEQPVDPLIAAAEGASKAPAHRGVAYALFKDFQLADYGNRIPSLTFEVDADDGPVEIGRIAEELSVGAVSAGETPALAGYAAGGDSLRAMLEGLAQAFPLSLMEQPQQLLLTQASGAEVSIDAAELGGSASARAAGQLEVSRRAASAIAGEVSILHHDPARDYQTGLQRAHRGSDQSGAERLALPAVLAAGTAKGLAEARLERLWASRQTAKLHLTSRRIGVRPGSLITIPGRPGRWKVSSWTLNEMVLCLEVVRVPPFEFFGGTSAMPGRSLPQADMPHGPTTLLLVELPSLGSEIATQSALIALAAGGGAGWRRAALLASYDGGVSWDAAGSTAAPAVIGRALTVVAPAGSALFDEKSAIDVELLNGEMWLEGRDDQALAAGANLALLGDELIQFGRAEPLGERKFRLTRLLRGRRGTDWAAGSHMDGEPFALLEQGTAAAINPPPGFLGAEVRLMAQGLGDGEEATFVGATFEGRALQPPSPVHLRAVKGENGDAEISWVRRSRAGWDWISGSDTALGEEAERYRLRIAGAAGAREFDLGEARFRYGADARAAEFGTDTLRVEVVQIGTRATSRPATIMLN